MTSEDVQLPRDQHARSPERAPSSLAQRVAHAVVESRGLTDVENDLQHGSEKTTRRTRFQTPVSALGIFFGLFLLIAWVVPSPRPSLGVPLRPERSRVPSTAPHFARDPSREDPMKNLISTALSASTAIAMTNVALADNHVLKLTSGGDAVVIPHHVSQNPGSAITIEYWIKWSGGASNGGNVKYGRPVSKRSGSSGGYSVTWFDLTYCDGELFQVGQVSPGIQLSTQWSHHAVTWSAASREIRFYLNGALVKTAAFQPTSLAASTDQLRFGNTAGFENSTQFKGMLDDVRIWSVERTAAQIAQTMCVSIGVAEASQYSGLVGSWTFESGVTDATGISNGTLAGTAAIVVEQVCTLSCPGDLDNSGFADAIDLATILTNWGAPSPKYPEADANGDGEVNGADLAIVLSGWGACP